MNLKAPKHCTMLYKTVRKDFTVILSFVATVIVELPHSHYKVIHLECALAGIELADAVHCQIVLHYLQKLSNTHLAG